MPLAKMAWRSGSAGSEIHCFRVGGHDLSQSGAGALNDPTGTAGPSNPLRCPRIGTKQHPDPATSRSRNPAGGWRMRPCGGSTAATGDQSCVGIPAIAVVESWPRPGSLSTAMVAALSPSGFVISTAAIPQFNANLGLRAVCVAERDAALAQSRWRTMPRRKQR